MGGLGPSGLMIKGPPRNRNLQQDQAREAENKTKQKTNLGMKGSEGKPKEPTEPATKQLRKT